MLEEKIGLAALPGAVLPPDFVANLIDHARKNPNWIGVWACSETHILGSGGFKGVPVNGSIEIGYGVSPEVEGRGVATLICGALVDYAFCNEVTKVIAHTLPSGLASQRVLQKNGFVFTGIHEDPEDGTVHRFERTLS